MITAKSRPFPSAAPPWNASARRVRSIELGGPAGRLEAVVNEGSPHAAFAAVIAHPHPRGGGSLHNKVVYHAMKVMNAVPSFHPTHPDPSVGTPWLGWPVLRFNFRGTGRSEGRHDGAAEVGDVLAALAWIENEYKLPVVAAGFSFGAAMTLAACCGNGGVASATMIVRALMAIGLPIRSGATPQHSPSYDYSFLAQCRIPKLFLSGDRDQFAAKTELIQVAAAAAEPKQVALVPGADHFFTGHLQRMQSALAGWLKELVDERGQRSGV